ncbi:toll/interleukin-1 receptor domain-containing protein [Streptomyces canus]|uniref:TIR domain-containing protein n=1 Tax=Streptomyces canus TaxID=58343 RepID=UPI0032490A26
MKVFLSWSDERSQRLAEFLSTWLTDVIQAIEPWISSRDIAQGSRPLKQIADELAGSNFGIVCVTNENRGSEWINFEAGALSKVLDDAMVVPLLLGIEKAQVTGPLSQFQMTEVKKKDEVRKLISDMNARLGEAALHSDRLARSFDQNWPALENAINELPVANSAEQGESVERSSEDLLNEVLLLARRQDRRLSTLEESYAALRAEKVREVEISPAVLEEARWLTERNRHEMTLSRERALIGERERRNRNAADVYALLDGFEVVGVSEKGDGFQIHLRRGPESEEAQRKLRDEISELAQRFDRKVSVIVDGKRIYHRHPSQFQSQDE